jgi:hypothetical protein
VLDEVEGTNIGAQNAASKRSSSEAGGRKSRDQGCLSAKHVHALIGSYAIDFKCVSLFALFIFA